MRGRAVRSSRPGPSPADADMGKKIACFYWLGVLLLTVSVRLYLFRNYYTINNDGILYIEAARHFWEGSWSRGLGSFYPPLFPLMIAGAFPLVGDWELAGQFWPLALGVLVLFPLFGLVRRIYGNGIAQVAVLFYTVSPYLARLSVHVRSEMPYIFFFVLALYLLQRGIDHESLLEFLLAGISSAIAYLIRSEGIGLMVVGSVLLLCRGWSRARLWEAFRRAGLLFLGFALFAAPYVLYLRQDTGSWLISRKAGLILSLGLAEYEPGTRSVTMEESERVGVVDLVRSHPFAYAKKSVLDLFRSLGVYFEAVHYSYLPFLCVGWYLFFTGRFWTKADFTLAVAVVFYIASFSLLYVNRRYAVPLVPLSLGWVAVGYVAFKDYALKKWAGKGLLVAASVLALFFAGTLPKTLQAVGREKFYLREAGLYLRGKPGRPTIVTTNGRVAFYAEGENRVSVKDGTEISRLAGEGENDILALDQKVFDEIRDRLDERDWVVDRKFIGTGGEMLAVLARRGATR